MKKMLAIALLSIFTMTQARAQDVLNEIVNMSYATLNDTTKSKKDRQTALFKYDAMNYLRSRVLTINDINGDSVDVTQLNAKIKLLNEQAYAMNTYISVYFKRLSECKKKNRKLVTYVFEHTTADNLLFDNEEDKLYVEAYLYKEDFPVPFSLNCDWIKSLELVRSFDWSDK